jgi:hypothetical protein
MDMSKLPRMSQSPEPPPAQTDPATALPAYATSPCAPERPPSFAEAWISIAVGLILLLMSPYTLQWLVSLISSYKPPFLPITDVTTGAEIPYTHSTFFFGHLCVFAFSLVLIIDGLVLFTRKPALIMIALVVTAITTLMNLIYVGKAMMNGEALPIVSALAVAFGVYIATLQWKLVQSFRPPLPRR